MTTKKPKAKARAKKQEQFESVIDKAMKRLLLDRLLGHDECKHEQQLQSLVSVFGFVLHKYHNNHLIVDVKEVEAFVNAHHGLLQRIVEGKLELSNAVDADKQRHHMSGRA